MSAAPKRVRVNPLAGCIRSELCQCGCMRTSADACTQWPDAVLDQLQQTLDRRDAASFSRDSLQGALMLELACLPGAERARAVAGQLNLLIEEADTAGLQAVLLLQAQVQQLCGAGGLS